MPRFLRLIAPKAQNIAHTRPAEGFFCLKRAKMPQLPRPVGGPTSARNVDLLVRNKARSNPTFASFIEYSDLPHFRLAFLTDASKALSGVLTSPFELF